MTKTTRFKHWLVAAACVATLASHSPPSQAQAPQGSSLAMPPLSHNASATRGQELLSSAQAALGKRDLAAAVGNYREIASLTAQQPSLRPGATALRQALIQHGIEAQLLPAVATTPQRLPGSQPAANVANANAAGANTAQQQVLQLIAQSQMALDKGDVQTAVQLTTQAKAVRLNPEQLAAVQTPLWKMTLQVDSAAKRRGLPGVSPSNPAASQYPVVQAGAVMPAGGSATATAGDIRTADYSSPATGPANATPAQATGPAILSAPPAADTVGGSDGLRLYQQGVEALSAGRPDEARQLFVQAWRFEGQLDVETRRQLQAKLQLMQQPSAPPVGANGELSALAQVDQETLRNRQRLYRHVTAELGVAYNDRINKPIEALSRINGLRANVIDSDVDESAKQALLAMVDRAIGEQQKYVDENRADIELGIRNDQVRLDLENERKMRLETDDMIAEKVEMFDSLMQEQRFAEALVVAKQVQALAPGSTIGTQMMLSSRTQVRRLNAEQVISNNEGHFVDYLLDAQDLNMVAPDKSMEFPEAESWRDLSGVRAGLNQRNDSLSVAEQEIKRMLATEVDVKFRNQPLGEVLKTLEMVTGVPLFIDEKALATARVDSSTPVTLDLTSRISLKNALNLILGQFDLTYSIGNDVLQVTTNEVKRGQLQVKHYRVADLVTPIPNFATSYEDGLAGALKAAYQMNTASNTVQYAPVSAFGLAGEPGPVSANQNPNMLAQYGNPMNPMSQMMPGASGQMRGASGGGSLADFTSIMQLIETTIAPDTWEAMGGPSTMAPYAQNLSLVVSTTSDVHDQILDLLANLRRLQNLQVTIEVRFISLSDSFFEQIGVDFDVAFDDNVTNLPADDSGNSVAVGLSGPGRSFTTDLDLRFENNNFNVAPIFGGVDPGALSTFGFAILSDIEAFFFVQAAQGDNRTNVMQAPKVTLFDGQSASIQDVSQRPFVTSIRPVVGDFAVAQQPIIVVLNEGTELNVQAVVSDDKRFVRLTLVPFFSQIGDVDTFTFTGSSTSSSSSQTTDPNTGEPIENDDSEVTTQGSTVQLPTFAFTSVNTTVSVPDGGTILLGGIKRLREGRGERGLPILSKLPYINRLFRNTAIGRDASSLMLMVTPRIIIQEEEEIAQTGFDPNR